MGAVMWGAKKGMTESEVQECIVNVVWLKEHMARGSLRLNFSTAFPSPPHILCSCFLVIVSLTLHAHSAAAQQSILSSEE